MCNVSWDDYFMTLVYLVAMRSKDRSTHIGAVVIGPDKEIRSTGYNSFPRGMNDNVEKRQDRPLKYEMIEHAERNACYNATLIGVSLKNCVMYTNGIPCSDCARAVIQSGIKEVVVDSRWHNKNDAKWKASCKISLEMFDEVGVKIRYWDGDIMDIVKFRHGKIFDGK